MFTQSLILVQSWPLSSSYVSSVWFWFRVDHCRPLMFSQSLILVQSWTLSSSYVFSEFDFGSELTRHCRPLMFSQSLILVQSWPLSSLYVFSEFDFGSELTRHCRPLMFSQSLILVQSWLLSSSYVFSEFDFGSELTIVVLLCFLSLVLVQSWPLSSSYVYSEFDFGSELTIVVLLCFLRVWFWFRVDHCRPLVFPQFDFGSELTIVVLLCFLRVWFWFRVDHCRPLMFSQSLILVQSWPLSSSCVSSVWFWFRVDHCRPLMFSQSLILVQSWPLSSSYVFSEFDFGSELTIVVLLCLLRVWFWFRVDHCRPLMFTQSLILVQCWTLSSSYVFSVWFWFRVDHCRPLMFSQSLILVQSWPLSSSYVFSEFDFGSVLTIVVLLCLLRVWFWFRVDHCRPLMFTQSLILVQCWTLSSSYVYSEFDFGSELTIVVLLCFLRVWFWFRVDPALSSSYVFSEFDFGSELTIIVLLCFLRVWFWFRDDYCRPLMFSQSLIVVQSWPLSSFYVFSEFDFGSELNIVVLLCFLRVWFWFSVEHCRPLMFTQSLILVQCWTLSSSYVYSEFDFGSELNIIVLLCFLRVWFWFSVEHCRPLMFTQSLILVQCWTLSSSYVYSEFDFGSELTIVVLLCLLRV